MRLSILLNSDVKKKLMDIMQGFHVASWYFWSFVDVEMSKVGRKMSNYTDVVKIIKKVVYWLGMSEHVGKCKADIA